jgi:hypothetical protein
MKFPARLCVVCAMAMLPWSHAVASTTGWGNVSSTIFMNFGSTGYTFFEHDGSRSALPACATVAGRFVIDTSSGGRLQAAALLTAKAMNKKIIVVGTGNCSFWSDTESVSYFIVED